MRLRLFAIVFLMHVAVHTAYLGEPNKSMAATLPFAGATAGPSGNLRASCCRLWEHVFLRNRGEWLCH
jgi:hypothetical protein